MRTREPREFTRRRDRAAARDRGAGRAVDRAREALRRGAAARGRARGARADLRGGLGVALPRGVARGDREDDDGRASARPGRRSCSRTGRSPGPRGAPARTRCACRCAGSGRQIGELVCDRDTPFTDDERALLASIAHHAAVALEHGRAVMRGVLAQEIHHRVKNNLQTVASLLRLQARGRTTSTPRKALEDSVNRILAIAAVHEVLTERRDDDVELGELLERLRAMLVQGLGAGKEVAASLEPVSLAGDRATALALVFSELLAERARARRRSVHVELAAARTARSCSRSPTTAPGLDGRRRRHGALDRARARPRRAQRDARAPERRRAARRGASSRH